MKKRSVRRSISVIRKRILDSKYISNSTLVLSALVGIRQNQNIPTHNYEGLTYAN